jgi:hypothetical protein
MVIVGALLAMSLLAQLLGAGGGGSGGEGESPLGDTGPSGLAAFVTLLEGEGIDVDRGREPLAGAVGGADREDGDETVLIVERFLDGDEEAAVRSRAETGRVVVVGVVTASGFGLGDDPLPAADAAVLRPDLLGGATTLSVGGQGWGSVGQGVEIVAGSSAGSVVVARASDLGGALVGVSSPSLLANDRLARADNAAAAIALVGGARRLVVFDGSFGGDDGSTGFAALPWRARWFLGGLCLAVGLAAFAVGRRNGPAELPHRELPPPRTAYLHAMGRLLERSARGSRGRRLVRRPTPRAVASDRPSDRPAAPPAPSPPIPTSTTSAPSEGTPHP